MVPLLHYVFPELPHLFIVATSLAVIFPNSIINVYNFSKHISIDWKKIIIIAFFSMSSGFIFAELAKDIPGFYLKLFFVVFILFMAVYMSKKHPSTDKKNNFSPKSYSYPIIGLSAGMISAFTGLGGGVVIIPLLILLLKLPTHKLSAYSNGIMLFTTLASVLSYTLSETEPIKFFTTGYVIPKLAILILVGSFIGSRFGVKLNQKLPPLILKRSFAALLLIVAVEMVIKLLSEV
jgi:uncharacterized membrane protein YfcA